MPVIDQWDPQIDAAGKYFNVNPKLLKTVIDVESGGNPNVPVGSHGEIGIAQIMPALAKTYGMDPSDPNQSIFFAAKNLREGLDANKGDPEGALRYYNGGPAASPDATNPYIQKALPAWNSVSDPTGTAEGSTQMAQNNTQAAPQASVQAPTTVGNNAVDPDEAAGNNFVQTLINPQSASKPDTNQSPQTPVDPDQAAGEAYVKSNFAVPDNSASSSTGGPVSVNTPAPVPTQHSFMQNLGAGFGRGVQDVVDTTQNLLNSAATSAPIQYMDKTFPFLGTADQKAQFAMTPQQQQSMQNDSNQWDQNYGSTAGGKIGRIAGQVAVTAPLAIGAGAAGAGTVSEGADLLSDLAAGGRAAAARSIDAGGGAASNAAFNTARALGSNGVNAGIKIAGNAAVGAGLGAGQAGLTGNNVEAGALTGGILPIVGSAAGPAIRGAGQVLSTAAHSQIGHVLSAVLPPALISGIGGHMMGAVADAITEGALGFTARQLVQKYGMQTATALGKVADFLNQNQLNTGLTGYLSGSANPVNLLGSQDFTTTYSPNQSSTFGN